jgi:hypothetical protein
VFINVLLRRLFGVKKEQVSGQFMVLYNENLNAEILNSRCGAEQCLGSSG